MDKIESESKPSFVKVDNIYAEDLFKWAWETMFRDGGDGGSAIICENPKEVSELFLEWFEKEYGYKNKFDIQETHDRISYTSGQDAMTITDNINHTLAFHEYVYIVESECVFGWTVGFRDKSIKAVKNEPIS